MGRASAGSYDEPLEVQEAISGKMWGIPELNEVCGKKTGSRLGDLTDSAAASSKIGGCRGGSLLASQRYSA